MLISTDSKYLFQTDTNRIKVQNIKSGEVVYHLNYENKLIEALCLNPLNKYQLLSFHNEGSVCLWDFEDGVLLKTYTTQLRVKKVSTLDSKQSVYALAVALNSEKELYSLYKLDFNVKNDEIKAKSLLENIDINLEKLEIDINYNAKFIALIQAKRRVIVYNIKKQESTRLQSKHELTCLTIHPNEDCIATGTTTGKIILWYGFLDNTATPTKTVLHWHALPVLSVCFTQEGSYLLSGGYECVLVKWMYKTGQKDFKPRLGSPIKGICCAKDNTIYALDHADNSSHVIGTNFSILQTFSGFVAPNLASNKENPFPAGLTYFSRLNCLVTNGKPGHLQFFMPTYEKLLFNLDIVDENYISPENLLRPKVHTEVDHLSFSSDSGWLTTVERRDDSVTTPEIKMKFWQFDQTSNKFMLNTIVRYPHSYEKLNKIKFKPKENVLVTCGSDACFKSWVLAESTIPVNTGDRELKSWVYDTCNGYRNMTPTDIEYSLNDKAQVAIAFNHVVTLWDSENYMEFVTDLVHCDANDHINQILYSGSYLVATHKNCINLWSLNSNYSCVWSKQLNVEHIARHPVDSSNVIVVVNSTTTTKSDTRKFDVAMLRPDEDDRFKVLNKAIAMNIDANQKLNIIYMRKSDHEEFKTADKNGLNDVDIFYCTNKMTLEKVELDSIASLTSSTTAITKLYKNLPENNLKVLLSQHKSQKFLDDQQKFNDILNMKSNLRKIDVTPAYLLPKVSSFCYDTLISMLEPIGDAEMEVVNNNDHDGGDSSDDGEVKQNGHVYQLNGDGSDDSDMEYDNNNNNSKKNKIAVVTKKQNTDEDGNLLKNFKLEDFLIKFSK